MFKMAVSAFVNWTISCTTSFHSLKLVPWEIKYTVDCYKVANVQNIDPVEEKLQ